MEDPQAQCEEQGKTKPISGHCQGDCVGRQDGVKTESEGQKREGIKGKPFRKKNWKMEKPKDGQFRKKTPNGMAVIWCSCCTRWESFDGDIRELG